MAEVAEVNDAQSVHVDDKDRILAVLGAADVVMVNANGADAHVAEGLVDAVPVEAVAVHLEAVENFCLIRILEDVDLGVVVVLVTDEHQVRRYLLAAVIVDGVRVKDYPGLLGGDELEKGMAVPANDHFAGRFG